MIDLNKKRSSKQWLDLLNNVKVSDLDFETKSKLIEDIEFKMNGKRYTDKNILKDIEDSMPDYDDIN